MQIGEVGAWTARGHRSGRHESVSRRSAWREDRCQDRRLFWSRTADLDVDATARRLALTLATSPLA